MSEEYLSAAQVADRLGVDRSTVLSWCATGRIPAIKLPGGHTSPWRIRLSDIEAIENPSINGEEVKATETTSS